MRTDMDRTRKKKNDSAFDAAPNDSGIDDPEADRFIEEALASIHEKELEKELEEINRLPDEMAEVSDRHKIRMNRIFREVVGSSHIPYPEVDNFFEWLRSRLVIAFSKFSK